MRNSSMGLRWHLNLSAVEVSPSRRAVYGGLCERRLTIYWHPGVQVFVFQGESWNEGQNRAWNGSQWLSGSRVWTDGLDHKMPGMQDSIPTRAKRIQRIFYILVAHFYSISIFRNENGDEVLKYQSHGPWYMLLAPSPTTFYCFLPPRQYVNRLCRDGQTTFKISLI